MTKALFRTPLAALGALLLSACGSPPPPELDQAARAVQHMTRPAQLSRSMFAAAFPEGGRPSQFVSYFFSSAGTAEWAMPIDEREAEAMRAARIPAFPRDVALLPRRPDPDKGKQLVLRYDDGRGVIIAEGYLDPRGQPALVREWTLPQVRPTALAEQMFRSNRGLGMSYQSF